MTRARARTLSALGVKWRMLREGFLIWIGDREYHAADYDQIIAIAATYWGRR